MGRAIKELNLPREELVVSTKIMKCGNGVNDTFLSRKHIVEGVKNCLKRLQLDYVDVIFAHRPDYETTLEETCQAFNFVIEQGWAFYWGTSEWTPDRIARAVEYCEKANLHKPIVEQCQYNMIKRENLEKNLKRAFEEYKYGTTIWSPLAGGVLTGKYNEGTAPEGSRYEKHQGLNRLWVDYFGSENQEQKVEMLKKLGE